eukprot:79053-Chlamydomonas_euryale.AAC.1
MGGMKAEGDACEFLEKKGGGKERLIPFPLLCEMEGRREAGTQEGGWMGKADENESCSVLGAIRQAGM